MRDSPACGTLPDPGLIEAARGLIPADMVFTDAEIFNPFTCSFERGNLAVKNGVVLGTGDYEGIVERDMRGKYLVPGLIDAHVHIESSLLIPREYALLVSRHGTRVVIADPHEIANVAGLQGIGFMLSGSRNLPVDIRYMVPSCVPATPADIGGAVLSAEECRRLFRKKGVLGLGEVMNVPGVLSGDPSICEKIGIFGLRDGHAPLLAGNDLNAYILAGLQSDHECTTSKEAEVKLRQGMYLYLREGSTERNIEELAPLITPNTVSRCCFATDDCHADLLMNDGHIDRCIRKAVSCGVLPELAIRMATLSAAERFGLSSYGALSPGRRADFCIVDDPELFRVKEVIVAGIPLGSAALPTGPRKKLRAHFACRVPAPSDLRITEKGIARVIGLIPGQILTETLSFECNGRELPDVNRDILKVVVCNRYGKKSIATGLVHGFGFLRGAIASTVSHDAHNLIAVGTNDTEIIEAIAAVVRMRGGMTAVASGQRADLPLNCGGLMSTLPFAEVVERIRSLQDLTSTMGGISDPFMYLSFLSLTVIPALRITDRGIFDYGRFSDVGLFV